MTKDLTPDREIWHIMSTLCDTLSTRKEEVPEDLCQDAVNALAGL
jgi:hypothetical protein